MKRINVKSIIALMVIAIAILLTSCGKEAYGFIDTDGDSPEPGVSYELVSSRHVKINSCALVRDSILVTCQHGANLLKKPANTDVLKEYFVFNPSKLGSTDVLTKDINLVQNRSFLWQDNAFLVGSSAISLILGKTYGTSISLGGRTWSIPELNSCSVDKIELQIGTATAVTRATTSYTAPAKLVFTLSCGETCEYDLGLINITETMDDITNYTRGKVHPYTDGQGTFVRTKFVNGVAAGTKQFFVTIQTNLSAEAKKTFSVLTPLTNPTLTKSAEKTWTANYNVGSHALNAEYPATIPFYDEETNENVTLELEGVWNVVFVNKNTVDNSTETRFIYNTTSAYKLTWSYATVTAKMSETTQELEQAHDKNVMTPTTTVEGETETDGVKIEHNEDNTLDKDQNFHGTFYAPSGITIKTEILNPFETVPIDLTFTSKTEGQWIPGAEITTSDGKVAYTPYTRVDTYRYNNGSIAATVTYTKNDDFYVLRNGKRYKATGLGTLGIDASAPSFVSNNNDANILSKTHKVVHSITRGSVSKTADQLFTLWRKRTPAFKEGCHIIAIVRSDVYDGSRKAAYRDVLNIITQSDTGNELYFLPRDKSGAEMNDPKIGNIFDITGTKLRSDVNGFAAYLSMVWNGIQFLPGYVVGVNNPDEKPTDWAYTSLDLSINTVVSPVSVSASSLRNPLHEVGKKINLDGEEVWLIDGKYYR